jgi:Raf kinase inhibitor-like YbhB/YbcL family protein
MSLDRPDAPDPYDILPPVPAFELASPDIADGQQIGMRFVHGSVGGENLSPQLRWSGFPSGTRGFVVTCFDPDAPTGSGFWHWMLVNLPAGTTMLHRNAGAGPGSGGAIPSTSFHVRNDFNEPRYDGPAPPAGDKPHRYVFAVHAMDVDALSVDSSAQAAFVGFNLTFHTLARAVLRPTFQIPAA